MNDQITLDHPSCHNPTGSWEASGEWEVDNCIIQLRARGIAIGSSIKWDYYIDAVEVYDQDGDESIDRFTAYSDPVNPALVGGVRWLIGYCEDISETSALWMLGVAYAWAKRDADAWAEANAEPCEAEYIDATFEDYKATPFGKEATEQMWDDLNQLTLYPLPLTTQ